MRVRATAWVAVPLLAVLLGACSGGNDSERDGLTALPSPTAAATPTGPESTTAPADPTKSPEKADRDDRPSPTLTPTPNAATRTSSPAPRATRARTAEPEPEPTRTKKSSRPSRTVFVIDMYDNEFQPANPRVEAGTYVRAVNRGQRDHTWTSGNPPSGNGAYDYAVAPGDSSPLYHFTTPGTYDFFCKPHASRLSGNMRGTITVTA